MQFGADVARALVAAAGSELRGSVVLNLPTPAIDMGTIVSIHRGGTPGVAGSITFDSTPLPFPAQPHRWTTRQSSWRRRGDAAEAGVESTIRHFERLLDRGLITPGS